MLTLTVSHSIFLTEEERTSLAGGNPVEVVGISLPVWFYPGSTSEPGNEVFCKYLLTNMLEDYPVNVLTNGYKINLPQLPPGIRLQKRLPPSELQKMSRKEIDEWNKEHPIPTSGLDLLSPERGGLGYLRFKRFIKAIEEGKRMNIVHAIEINQMEVLDKSLSL
jgi:hypothetical protein